MIRLATVGRQARALISSAPSLLEPMWVARRSRWAATLAPARRPQWRSMSYRAVAQVLRRQFRLRQRRLGRLAARQAARLGHGPRRRHIQYRMYATALRRQ